MGIQYSPIASLNILKQLHKRELLGNYLLVLAHDVLENRLDYEEFFVELREYHTDMFVILDNSAFELGAALHAKYLLAAANIVKADTIVLPDIMGNAEDTYKSAHLGAASLISEGCSIPFMVVPHGKSVPQLFWCIQQLAFIKGVHYWGVPRILVKQFGGRGVLDLLLSYGCASNGIPNVHMLGMSDDIMDDIWCCTRPNVMGIDSANPVVMGMKGYDLTEMWAHCPRPENYFEFDTLEEMSAKNVLSVRVAIVNFAQSVALHMEQISFKDHTELFKGVPGHLAARDPMKVN